MKTIFDVSPDRRGTNSIKWDLKPSTPDGRDMLPMWVADMDFGVPEVVREALRRRLEHPVFGYSFMSDEQRDAYTGWQRRRNNWAVPPEWLMYAPGVMPAVRAAVLTYSEPGDEVILQPPVYYPFFHAIRDNDRTVLENPLMRTGSTYEMDLDHLESVITPRTRMMILCSPHNPVARVWTRDELSALAQLCLKHDITVISDEIHSDLILDGHVFTPFGAISQEVAEVSVTTTSPTKTFNIAGIASSFLIAPGEGKRGQLKATMSRLGMELPNDLSLTAAAAAYSGGDEWLDALLAYLNETVSWLQAEVSRRLPGVGFTTMEGTYLAWLDVRQVMEAAGVDDAALQRVLKDKAGLWLSDGIRFGSQGSGFLRMNLACPRDVVANGLDRLVAGLGALA